MVKDGAIIIMRDENGKLTGDVILKMFQKLRTPVPGGTKTIAFAFKIVNFGKKPKK